MSGAVVVSIEARRWVAINAALWLLVMVSALAVVRVTHESREQLNALEKARREAAALHVQWGQYLLEQGAWGALGRIEQEATEKLHMVLPKGEQLIVVVP